MPWQLIYTSAPRLLKAGQTGFGTVARHQAVPPLVVSAVERASQFARLPGMDAERVVYCYRIVDAAGSRFHVLSRTASAGADYTGRTNHLAHHVILAASEVAHLSEQNLTPGEVLLRYPWLASWNDAPKWFGDDSLAALVSLPPDKKEHLSLWSELTGNPMYANHLLHGPGARGSMIVAPPKTETLRLYAEALRSVPDLGWQFTFTTELDPGDEPGDFRWIGFSAGSPHLANFQAGRRLILDLTRPQMLPFPEPLPERQAAAARLTREIRTAPPRVASPMGSTFVEPSVPAPVPRLADDQYEDQEGTDSSGHPRRPRQKPRKSSAGGIITTVVVLGLGIVGAMYLAGSFRSTAPEVVPWGVGKAASSSAPPVVPSGEMPKPMIAVPEAKLAPVPTPATPTVPAPAVVVVPLRVCQAANLGQLVLPELRSGQVHMLVTRTGEELGPLNEARNSLWVSLADTAPALKLDYGAQHAHWTAEATASMTPPLQWRVLQDKQEVLRVLIGDSSNPQPVNGTPISATQDPSGTIGGDITNLVQRLGNQSLWLRLPQDVQALLKECGYAESLLVPFRNGKADTSNLIGWVVKEHTKAVSLFYAPIAESSTPAPSSGGTGFTERPGTRVSDRANSLGNRPAPTSSVAGKAEDKQEAQRALAQRRMDKLAALRNHPVLQARLASTTCSLFVGPPQSMPTDSVWICDVVVRRADP